MWIIDRERGMFFNFRLVGVVFGLVFIVFVSVVVV